MIKVLVTGDSHTGALQRGKERIESREGLDAGIAITVQPLGGGHIQRTAFFRDRRDHLEIVNETYRESLQVFPVDDGDGAPYLYGLCMSLHSTWIWRHEDWARFAPAGIAVGEAPVSNALLRAAVLDDVFYVLRFIDVLKRLGQRMFVVEAPRPFVHHPAFETTRKEVIAHVDGYYRDVVLGELARRDVPVVRVPESCHDSSGFMVERYRHENPEDHHHGNAEYGELMIRRIEQFCLNWAASVPA